MAAGSAALEVADATRVTGPEPVRPLLVVGLPWGRSDLA
jgi:hypothetical protein